MCAREQSSAAWAAFILAIPKQFPCNLSMGVIYVCRINKLDKHQALYSACAWEHIHPLETRARVCALCSG